MRNKFIIPVIIVLSSLILFANSKQIKNKLETKNKKQIDFSSLNNYYIEFEKNKLCINYYREDEIRDSIIISLTNSKDYKDVLYLDTAGYLYITNDLRNPDKVFTSECKSGIADLEGNVLVKAIYDRIYVYDQTIKGFVITELNKKLGLADKTGKIAARNEFDNIYEDFTNQGFVAVLVKGNEFFSLDKNYKISKINSNNSVFKEKWDNYSLISEEIKDKLFGYSLLPVDNNKYEDLYLYNSFEPKFENFNKLVKTNQHFQEFGVYSLWYNTANTMKFFTKLSNNLYTFLCEIFLYADRDAPVFENQLIVVDNKLKIKDHDENRYNYQLDSNIFVSSYNHKGRKIIDNSEINNINSMKNNEDLFVLENYFNSEIDLEFYLLDTNSENNRIMIKKVNESNSKYYYVNHDILSKSIDKFGKIVTCKTPRNKYFFTKIYKLNDSLLRIPFFYERNESNYETSYNLYFRNLNKQELQEMLEEILAEYNHDESKLNEIDRYNVNFLREKIASGISKIEGIK